MLYTMVSHKAEIRVPNFLFQKIPKGIRQKNAGEKKKSLWEGICINKYFLHQKKSQESQNLQKLG